MLRDWPVDEQGQERAGNGERQGHEHGHGMDEAVELRGQDHVGHEDAEKQRDQQPGKGFLERLRAARIMTW